MPRLTLEDGRLRLEPFGREHAGAVTPLIGHPLVADTTANIPHPYSEEDARVFADMMAVSEACSWVIVRREDDQLVGGCGLRDFVEGDAEIGYWIGVPYWGRGYATEAVRIILAHAFDDLGLRRVHACYYTRNPASGRVMAKAGMRSASGGACGPTVIARGREESVGWMAITAETWHALHSDAGISRPGAPAMTTSLSDAVRMIDFEPKDALGQRVLFTPGPVTTSPGVRAAATLDVGSWDSDTTDSVARCKRVLLDVVCRGRDDLVCTLVPGSGTYAVEAMIGSSVAPDGKLLILSNGLYGQRLLAIATQLGIPVGVVTVPEDRSHDASLVDAELARGGYTHLATCHVETTAGVVHDLNAIGAVAQKHGVRMLVDAMASFCGYTVGPAQAIDFDAAPIDHIVASANKCAQGLPGLSYVISRRDAMERAIAPAPSMSLDLKAQWQLMESTGRFRYTPPTHVLLAFERALLELQEETVEGRIERFKGNQRIAIERINELGCATYIPDEHRSHINTTFLYPTPDFDFDAFKAGLRREGFIIFPQQVTQADAFRVGAIGHIGPVEVHMLCDAIARVLGRA